MSTDSDGKLTKHTTAVTVVTAEFANSIYGGEYAGSVGPGVDEFQPKLSGHVHDGQHIDGHASQVSLSPDSSSGRKHVRGHLLHGNLSDGTTFPPAVQVSNIQSYEYAERENAIPEWIDPGPSGNKEYYLDLSMSAGGSDTHVQYNEDGGFGGDDGFIYEYDSGRVVVSDSSKVYIDVSDSAYARVGNLYSSSDTLSLESFGSVRIVIDNNGNQYDTMDKRFDILGPTGLNVGVTPQEGDSGGGQDSGSLLMTVLQSGNVGIGTSDPQLHLHIDGGDDVTESNDTGYLMIGDPDNEHLAFDNNEILARDGSTSSTLYLQHAGSSNLVMCSGGGGVGIGTSPDRTLHIQDAINPPLRINDLTVSTGDVMVWDSSTGDVYIDSSIGSDQDLWATFTADDANTATANSTTDTLTVAGGSGISTSISGDTLTITNDSPNVDQDLWATFTADDANTATANSTTDTLTVAGGSGISTSISGDTLTIAATGGPSAGSYMTTQWVGAESWIQYDDGNTGGHTFGKGSDVLLVQDSGTSRWTGCTVIRDNSNDILQRYFSMVPIPLNQNLSSGPGPIAGAHSTGAGADNVSGFAAAAPLSCRVTCFFILKNNVGDEHGFKIKLTHNAQSPTTNMFEYADGSPITSGVWTDQDLLTGNFRINDHLYDTATFPGLVANAGYHLVISDFSTHDIEVAGNLGGMFEFSVEAYDFSGWTTAQIALQDLYFVGARLQWIWA